MAGTTGGLLDTGAKEQPPRLPTIAANAKAAHDGLNRLNRSWRMGLILLEALLAGLVFVLIVWWTMFSGRKNGELPQAEAEKEAPSPAQADPATVVTPEKPAQPPK
jgi:hypothetical protein